MRHTLKIGITVLVVAAMAMSGIALAQSDEAGVDQPPPGGAILERLAPLVDDGTITQAQAEAVAEVLAEGRRPQGRRGPGLHQVAEFLGISVEGIRAALAEGSTLAEVAAANGSSADALIGFMVGEAEEHLAQAVADGRLDQSEADEKLVQITQRITDIVNGTFEPRDGGPGDRSGPPPGDGGA